MADLVNDAGSIFLTDTHAVETLRALPAESVDLIATDPPWNTGGWRVGAAGRYHDSYTGDEFQTLIDGILTESKRVLKPTGTLCMQLDYRWAPLAAVRTDEIFLADCRVGEIIVESLLGNPGKKHWPVKHSNIMVVAADPTQQYFDYESLPTVQRKPNGAGKRTVNGKEYSYTDEKKVASVLSATMSNTDGDRTGYPDQKLTWLFSTLIRCFTPVGGFVVDPFAGSGTTGAAAAETGRRCLLGDINPEAREVIRKRLNLESPT